LYSSRFARPVDSLLPTRLGTPRCDGARTVYEIGPAIPAPAVTYYRGMNGCGLCLPGGKEYSPAYAVGPVVAPSTFAPMALEYR
jgi:hypothetical protein